MGANKDNPSDPSPVEDPPAKPPTPHGASGLPQDFGPRLALALQRLNLSRDQVSGAVAVDKSVVSRWVRGHVKPSDHNLTRLTRLIAERAPGFSRRDWGLPLAKFERSLEGDAGEWLPKAAEQSRGETAGDGDRYPGLYVQIRQRFSNTGRPFAELAPIWREGAQLKVKYDGPGWAHQGRIFILGHQLFVAAEDLAVNEGLCFQILNGVPHGKALAMDGVLATVPHDRGRAPGATMTLMLRVADLRDPDSEPDPDLLKAYQTRIATLVDQGRVEELAGPAIIDHVSNRLGLPREDGAIDYLLRAPASRGMTVSRRGESPVIDAAIERWRAALRDIALPGGAG